MRAPEFFQPKGSMCSVCVHKLGDCNNLIFEEMPIMQIIKNKETDTRTAIVRCKGFVKDDNTTR